MRISTFGQTDRVYGGSPARDVGNHLELICPGFGPAIENLIITVVYLGGQMVPGQTVPLIATNSRRFERKRKTLRATWVAKHVHANEMDGVYPSNIIVDLFRDGFRDVEEAISFAMDGVGSGDDFDAEEFLGWVKQVGKTNWGSDEDLRRLLLSNGKKIVDSYKNIDPWDALDIDWSLYPAKAREILDDPSDWSTDADFSPHGNDTGYDLFFNWDITKQDSIKNLARNFIAVDPNNLSDPLHWRRWVQLHTALAFGYVKTKANCPNALRLATIDILERDRSRSSHSLEGEDRAAWLDLISRYIDILKGL